MTRLPEALPQPLARLAKRGLRAQAKAKRQRKVSVGFVDDVFDDLVVLFEALVEL